MLISCFPRAPNYFPQRPSRGRAAALAGPTAFPQARRAPAGPGSTGACCLRVAGYSPRRLIAGVRTIWASCDYTSTPPACPPGTRRQQQLGSLCKGARPGAGPEETPIQTDRTSRQRCACMLLLMTRHFTSLSERASATMSCCSS